MRCGASPAVMHASRGRDVGKLSGHGQGAVAHAPIPIEVPCEEVTEACLALPDFEQANAADTAWPNSPERGAQPVLRSGCQWWQAFQVRRLITSVRTYYCCSPCMHSWNAVLAG